MIVYIKMLPEISFQLIFLRQIIVIMVGLAIYCFFFLNNQLINENKTKNNDFSKSKVLSSINNININKSIE